MPDAPGSSDPSSSRPQTTRSRAAPKPRAVQRKSKAEREEHARREAERTKEREISDATTIPKTAVRGARGSTRGNRGGRTATTQNDRSTASVGAGVFGAGRGDRPDRAKGPIDLGVSEALDGNDTPKVDLTPATNGAEGGPSGASAGVGGGAGGRGGGGGGGRGKAPKTDADVAIFLDEDNDDLPRRDIEKIWISSDDDEDAIISRKGKQRRTSKTQKSGAGLRPVRAARTVVEEDHEGDVKSKRIKKTTDDSAIIDVDTDEMQIDQVSGPTKKDPPSSPELGKKTARKSDSKPKDARTLIETVEERAERLRLHEDIQGLREAFVHKSDTDETIESKDDDGLFSRADHNRMFLFQLPPLVPQLYDPTAKPPPDPDVMETDQADPAVKTEPGTSTNVAQKDGNKTKSATDAGPQTLTAQSDASQRLSAGLVGKLKIHKSGKVTLDWGGTDMEVRYGTEVDFLQDVVCVENPDVPEEQEDEDSQRRERIGKAHALGQVHKKMVLIPDWSKLYA